MDYAEEPFLLTAHLGFIRTLWIYAQLPSQISTNTDLVDYAAIFKSI